MKTKFPILATLVAGLLTSTAPVAMANVAVCGRTLFTPPGSNVFTGTWHRVGGQQLCAGLVVHGDDTATYVFGDGNLTHPQGGTVSDNGKTYSFVDDEGSTFTFHSDGSASFSGGSGKMVGQFNVYHMPGVAAVPKPDEGQLTAVDSSLLKDDSVKQTNPNEWDVESVDRSIDQHHESSPGIQTSPPLVANSTVTYPEHRSLQGDAAQQGVMVEGSKNGSLRMDASPTQPRTIGPSPQMSPPRTGQSPLAEANQYADSGGINPPIDTAVTCSSSSTTKLLMQTLQNGIGKVLPFRIGQIRTVDASSPTKRTCAVQLNIDAQVYDKFQNRMVSVTEALESLGAPARVQNYSVQQRSDGGIYITLLNERGEDAPTEYARVDAEQRAAAAAQAAARAAADRELAERQAATARAEAARGAANREAADREAARMRSLSKSDQTGTDHDGDYQSRMDELKAQQESYNRATAKWREEKESHDRAAAEAHRLSPAQEFLRGNTQ